MKKQALLGIVLYLCLPFVSPVWADWSGTVVDVDGRPISNVGVSDGLAVVSTDAQGAFSLPERDGARFIFISTPAGYKVRGKFYQRISKVDSSAVDSSSATPLTATTSENTSVNDSSKIEFVLEPWAASAGEIVRFVQISDVEQSEGDLSWFDAIRRYRKETPFAFLTSSGDICYPNGLIFNAENIVEESLGAPVYHSIGNHDLTSGKYGEELYESLFGPCWYSFDAGPIHFVVTPMPSGDYRPSYSQNDVANWLKNDLNRLAPETPVVVFQHSAPSGGKFDAPASFQYGDVDLKSFNLKGWFFGHYHTSVFHKNSETGITFGSFAPPNKGGIDHSVASFYVVEMDADGIRSIDKRNSYWNGERRETLVSEPNNATILTPLWSADAGAEIHFGEPLPTEFGVVVATADDGNRQNCAVVAFDSNGNLRWKTPVANSIKSALTSDSKMIYATDQAWTVYALDLETGEIVWRDEQGAEPTSLMVAPTLRDGVLFAGQGNGLTAYEAATGKIIWRNKSWSGGEGTTARLVFVDGLLLASANWRALYAHRPETGELVWQASVDHLRFRSSAPVPFNDAQGNDVILATNDSYVQTLDSKTGALLQEKLVGRNLQTASSALVLDDSILVGSADAGLCAFDRETFEPIWNVPTGENLVYSSPYTKPVCSTVEASPIRVGKYVVFGALDGTLYVVDPTAQNDAKVLQKFDFGAPILASATLSSDGKTLYVADYSGRVSAFAVASEK